MACEPRGGGGRPRGLRQHAALPLRRAQRRRPERGPGPLQLREEIHEGQYRAHAAKAGGGARVIGMSMALV